MFLVQVVSAFESPIVLVRSLYEFHSMLVLFVSLKQSAVERCMYYTHTHTHTHIYMFYVITVRI